MLLLYCALFMATVWTALSVQAWNRRADEAQVSFEDHQAALTASLPIWTAYRAFKAGLPAYAAQGVATEQAAISSAGVVKLVAAGQYVQAKALLAAASTQLDADLAVAKDKKQQEDAAAEAAKQQGGLKGVLTAPGATLASCSVALLSGQESVASAVPGTDGAYALAAHIGLYNVTAQCPGFTSFAKEGVSINSQEQTVLDIVLAKPAPTPTPKPVASATPRAVVTPTPAPADNSDPYSYYRQVTVRTSKGSFDVKLLTLELGSGHVRVEVDTASDTDCTNNCPVKPVKQYVDGLGGFAGVNGTYLCPADYASCAGQTGSFYYKVFNSRLGVMINANNKLGEHDPFLAFDRSGNAKFYDEWFRTLSSSFPIYSGISCRPLLVYQGANKIDPSTLDSKELTAHTIRTGLGMKGTTLYVAVPSGATVPDLADIMVSLGVDNAINLDGGGSSALYYKGSYKTGPGRNVPNALVFVRQ